MNTTDLWRVRFSNYGVGALTLATSLTLGSLVLQLYRAIAGHVFVFWPANPWFSGVLAFVVIDFIYYWQHRAEHRVGLLWALHAVHHQAQICDTSVSLRTSFLNPVVVLAPHLLLAISGLSFSVYLTVSLLHFALIFLLHSRTPKWFDRAGWFFNSPYIHRGHHSNAAHLKGKNFGGVLVVWDRVFRTFEANCEVDGFGLGQAATPMNPLDANLQPLARWLRLRKS